MDASATAPLPGSAAGSLHVALRTATAAAHAALDQQLGDVLDGASLDGYTRFLSASYEVVAPLEQGLASWLPTFAAGDRAQALRADLKALHAWPLAGPAAAAALLTDVASAHGAAYVLEGSRLGGKVLARRLAVRLAPRTDCFAYLRSADAAGNWPAFLAALDQFGLHAGERARAAACAAAMATFAAYAQAFARKGLIRCP